jgi:hypothetical protein
MSNPSAAKRRAMAAPMPLLAPGDQGDILLFHTLNEFKLLRST